MPRSASEREIILTSIRLINWIQENKINVIALKGTAAVPLRHLIANAWKASGYPIEEMPKIIALGKTRNITHDSENIEALEQAIREKRPKTYAEFQNPKNRILFLDEYSETGLGITKLKQYFQTVGKARIFSGAFSFNNHSQKPGWTYTQGAWHKLDFVGSTQSPFSIYNLHGTARESLWLQVFRNPDRKKIHPKKDIHLKLVQASRQQLKKFGKIAGRFNRMRNRPK
ncbi:MAG: hypothetical protein Q7S92_04780 [Candidatus Diapherotrites archaeon]|nr:hypothetical protein [Candidatus Diapherotrites archaeon]